MTRKEFFDKTESFGFALESLDIFVDKVLPYENAAGIYREKDHWVVYRVRERSSEVAISYSGDEETAFSKIWETVLYRAKSAASSKGQIPSEVLCTTKEEMIDYISANYDMDLEEAEEQWEYLRKNFIILSEFKYFIKNDGKFIPAEFAASWHGYTAQMLYETTMLSSLGAFNYMIYLYRKPKEALKNLKDGLPVY